MNRARRARIVATLGPASRAPSTVKALAQAGVDVFRLNFSHGSHEDHAAALKERDDLRLRVAVQPGGCSGLRYQLYFDDRSLDGDSVAEYGSVKVVTDKMSTPYLMGATIDFVDTIQKQGFTIDNPNAQGSCACGDSFN